MTATPVDSAGTVPSYRLPIIDENTELMSLPSENQDTESTLVFANENRLFEGNPGVQVRNDVVDNDRNASITDATPLSGRAIPGRSHGIMRLQYGHYNRKIGSAPTYAISDKGASPMSVGPERSYIGPQQSNCKRTLKTKLPPLLTAKARRFIHLPVYDNENIQGEECEEIPDDTDSSWGSPVLSPIRGPYTFRWNGSLSGAALELTDIGVSKRIVRRWTISEPPVGIQEERLSYPSIEPKKGENRHKLPPPIAAADLRLPFDLKDGDSVQRYVSMVHAGNGIPRFYKGQINLKHLNPPSPKNNSHAKDTGAAAAFEVAIIKCKSAPPTSASAYLDTHFLKVICALTFIDQAKNQSGNEPSNKARLLDNDDGYLCRIKFIIHPSMARIAVFLAAIVEFVFTIRIFSELANLVLPYTVKPFRFLLWLCGFFRLDRFIQVHISGHEQK